MLTNKDFKDINRTIGTISNVSDTQRIPLSTILAIIDFILIGIREIFFDKMGKPKSKMQLVFSLPAIIKFVAEVVKRITGNVNAPKRVKAISNEQKAVEAIDKAVKRAKDA